MKNKVLAPLAIVMAVVFLASFTIARQAPSTAKGTQKAVVTHKHDSDMGRKCNRCDGSGTIYNDCPNCDNGNRECQLCYGKCEIRCSYCQGGGSFRCNRCAGRGTIGDSDCPNCDGKGEIQCEQCRGTKIISCPSCGAKGLVPCMTCDGKGYTSWNCPDCGGTGEIDD